MQDYWWVTRPKRKLNPIPEELAAFCSTALGKKWTRNRDSHIEFEIELEQTGTKREENEEMLLVLAVELMRLCCIVWDYGLKRMKQCF